MSGLAMILVEKGYSVSGSDKNKNKQLSKLLSKGIQIFHEQTQSNINKLCKTQKLKPIIVKSSAISKKNIELIAAKRAKLTILHRSEILALLINNYQSIVVAGSHGKTSTSTFITSILAVAKKDPTFAIGGIVPHYYSNSNVGKGELFIAEADESDGTLTRFYPKIGIITNIELDHIDHYHSIQELTNTMKKFGRNCDLLIGNYDCKTIQKNLKVNYSYSIKQSKSIDFSAIPIELNGNGTKANYFEQGKLISQIDFKVPGLHNLSNLIGAIASCRIAGISFEKIQGSLQSIKGPLRRFEFRVIWQERLIVDDYAHHPSEIKATTSMARLMLNSPSNILPNTPKRLLAVFQPHRYTRTKSFVNEFALSLAASGASIIFIAPIYSAGEEEIQGFNHYSLAQKIQIINPNISIYVAKNFKDLIALIAENSLKNDLILNMGAGDINTVWQELNSYPNDDFQNEVKMVA